MAENKAHLTLVKKFQIPTYAQDMLYLVTASGTVPTQGETGTFDLEIPEDGNVQLRWAAPTGPILAAWDNISAWSTLKWDGHVKIGGFIERFLVVHGNDEALAKSGREVFRAATPESGGPARRGRS